MTRRSKRIAVEANAMSQEPRDAIRSACEAGFGGVSFDAVTASLDLCALSGTGRREFRHLLRRSELALVAVRADAQPGDIQDADRLLSRAAVCTQAARDLGAGLLRIDVGRVTDATDAVMLELCAIADRMGVRLGISAALSGFESIDRVLRPASGAHVGVDLDTLVMLTDAWPVEQIISRLGSRVVHVRARDAVAGERGSSKPAVIGKGDLRWPEVLGMLDAAAYRGWLTVDPLDLPDRARAALDGLGVLESLIHS
ncbi:MAG: sugar phosphate isomerase/epimerase family protein [Tepidisphaeraceae bacterium]